MNSYIFSSPFLKFKNNKVYLLNKYNLNNNNYDEDTYFINFNEIEKKKIKINNIDVEYNILLNEDNKNLLIKIDVSDNMEELEINKILYYIEKYISGCEDFDNINQDIDSDILKKYDNKYIKI
jgi:hypothetical protein